MKKMRHTLVLAAAAAIFPCLAKAAALVDLQILASSDGTNYSSNLQVTSGQTYDFEVIGQLAPVGTTNNSNPSNPITITSEVSGTDGMGSSSYNLNDAGSNPIQISFTSATLQGTFAQGTGAMPGTATNNGTGTSNNELYNALPTNPNGVFVGINGSPTVLESGTFTVQTAPALATSTVTGSFGGTVSALKINGGSQRVNFNTTTESSSDPIQQIAPLTLTASASPVPEPASVAVFGIGAIVLLGRRRRVV